MRSWIQVPADKEKALGQVAGSGADVVVVDLARAGNADADRLARVRHDLLQQGAGLGTMIAARRLNQRNRACQGTPVAIQNGFCVVNHSL